MRTAMSTRTARMRPSGPTRLDPFLACGVWRDGLGGPLLSCSRLIGSAWVDGDREAGTLCACAEAAQEVNITAEAPAFSHACVTLSVTRAPAGRLLRYLSAAARRSRLAFISVSSFAAWAQVPANST